MCRFLAAAVVSLLASGCAIGGSWRTESVKPDGAAFPINEITLAGGKYTATGLFTAQGAYSGDRHTTTGDYSFSGTTLTLTPGGGPALKYKTARRLDGKLTMTFTPPNQNKSVTAILAPVKPAS